MATVTEITSDPRWARANADQRKRLLSQASDGPSGLRSLYEKTQEYIPAAVGIGTSMLATPAAGALAAQGTDVGRRMLNVALGIPTPTTPGKVFLGNVGQAASMIPGELTGGAIAGASKIAPGATKAALSVAKRGSELVGMGAKALGRGVSSGLQATTGIAAERFGQQFADPTVPIPVISTVRKWLAGKSLGKAIEKEGFKAAQGGREVFDPMLSQARSIAAKAADTAEGRIRPTLPPTRDELGQLMVSGRRAGQRVIRGTSYKDRTSIPAMLEKIKSMDRVLMNLAPGLREKFKNYSQKAMAAEFSNLAPLVMSGNVSYMKTLIPAFAALGGTISPAGFVVGALSSPIAMGYATGLAGLLNMAIRNPGVQKAILSQASEKLTGE